MVLTELEISAGHWSFSGHFKEMADQFSVCSALQSTACPIKSQEMTYQIGILISSPVLSVFRSVSVVLCCSHLFS